MTQADSAAVCFGRGEFEFSWRFSVVPYGCRGERVREEVFAMCTENERSVPVGLGGLCTHVSSKHQQLKDPGGRGSCVAAKMRDPMSRRQVGNKAKYLTSTCAGMGALPR